jgi:hypothetical protein
VATDPVDVFEKGYGEVLAALKHQDDKLNRVLTALAFLTGAGVALMLNAKNIEGDSPMRLGTGPEAADVTFVVFLGAVVVALALALAAIGPSSPLGLPRKGRDPDSLLFWGEIARDDDWDRHLTKSAADLEKAYIKDLHEETRGIAQRTRYKVSRAREASAFVYLAIVCLSLIGIFGTGALSEEARWWAASVVLTVTLLLPFVDGLHMKLTRFPEIGAASWKAYVLLGIAVAATAALLVLGQTDGHERTALYTALSVLLLSRLAMVRDTFALVLLPVAALGAAIVLIVVMA